MSENKKDEGQEKEAASSSSSIFSPRPELEDKTAYRVIKVLFIFMLLGGLVEAYNSFANYGCRYEAYCWGWDVVNALYGGFVLHLTISFLGAALIRKALLYLVFGKKHEEEK